MRSPSYPSAVLPRRPNLSTARRLTEADLLRLMIDWGTLRPAPTKQLFSCTGGKPAPPPDLPNPGAASEERLWAEIVAWLEKIAADTDLYDVVQHIQSKVRGEEEGRRGPLIRMEQEVHRVTLDMMQIAGLLPYHLYRRRPCRIARARRNDDGFGKPSSCGPCGREAARTRWRPIPLSDARAKPRFCATPSTMQWPGEVGWSCWRESQASARRGSPKRPPATPPPMGRVSCGDVAGRGAALRPSGRGFN